MCYKAGQSRKTIAKQNASILEINKLNSFCSTTENCKTSLNLFLTTCYYFINTDIKFGKDINF